MTKCYYCNQGHCTTHEKFKGVPGKMYRTGVQYSKLFNILDPKSGKITEITIRSNKERKKSPHIEVERKIATCSLCQIFTNVTNYFVPTPNGSSNVNICTFCNKKFSNKKEKINFILYKLKERLGEWVDKDPNYSKLFDT